MSVSLPNFNGKLVFFGLSTILVFLLNLLVDGLVSLVHHVESPIEVRVLKVIFIVCLHCIGVLLVDAIPVALV